MAKGHENHSLEATIARLDERTKNIEKALYDFIEHTKELFVSQGEFDSFVTSMIPVKRTYDSIQAQLLRYVIIMGVLAVTLSTVLVPWMKDLIIGH